jgi:enamine deaminase RidA (YjgF/YER057c/UK114 family)
MRANFSTGAKLEDIVGYSRAVRVGNQLEVTGTVAVDEQGMLVGKGSVYEQTRFILEKIKRVVEKAGFRLEDVVRTRLFVTDITRWEEAGRAHREYFGHIKPATTLVEVRSLISPEFLVEVEVTAIKEQD